MRRDPVWAPCLHYHRCIDLLRIDLTNEECCEALSSMGASFRNHGVLGQVGEIPIFIKFHIVKSYPNEEFSIHIEMIFNEDSNCIHLMFWLGPLIQNIRHDLSKSWESWDQLLDIKFHDVSCSLNVIPGDSWYLHTCVLKWGDCFAPPLIHMISVPSMIVNVVWCR